jgi:Fe-S cluster assembly ATPase SufC
VFNERGERNATGWSKISSILRIDEEFRKRSINTDFSAGRRAANRERKD